MADSPTKDTEEFFDLDSHPEFGAISNSSTVDDDDDGHRSVSPLNPAESFFLSPELRTSQISAFALATELRHKTGSRHGRSRSGLSTVATDDFLSAAGSEADIVDRYNLTTNRSADAFFGKDIIIEQDESMTRNEESINAAQTAYGKTKEIWAWGKDLPVIGFFEGVAESVASKVVEMAGTTLEDVDQTIIAPQLAGLDTSFLNPIVEKIVNLLMAGGAKSNELIGFVAKPLGLIEAEEKKEPVKTIAPEVTSTKRNAGVF